MKPIISLIIFLMLSAKFLNAQDSSSFKKVIFNATVTDINHHRTHGCLYAISDSSVFFSEDEMPLQFSGIEVWHSKVLDFSNIEKLRLQRKGSAGKGAIVGAIGGGLFGGIGAIITANETSQLGLGFASGSIIASGFLFGTLGGALIGAGIASLIHKTFFIHGSKERFREMRNKMIATLAIGN